MAHDHGNMHRTVDGNAGHQRRLMLSLALTSTVFMAEVVSAVLTDSLALLVDAGHMLTDMSVLIASTVTAILMRRKPNSKRTWGWARLEVLTAAVGALVLLLVGVYALVEAGMRLFGGSADGIHDVRLLLFMGVIGLAANVGSIFIL
ncbi:MAG TPA: cation transporter, partial [Bifidobacterium sp.]|nr:cation transporter [Bifidobacterium sp.]